MKKRLLCVFVVLVLVAAICLLPLPRNVSETLEAVKLDSQGNAIGTVQIPLQITQTKSLLQTKLRKVSIDSFDGLNPTGVLQKSEFSQDPILGYWSISIAKAGTVSDLPTPQNPTIDETRDYSYLYTVAFDNDLERWMISISYGKAERVYYLGSVDQKYTQQELMTYFGISSQPIGRPSQTDPSTPPQGNVTDVQWTMHGSIVSSDAQVQKELELSIAGQIHDLADDTDTLDLAFTFPEDFPYMSEETFSYPRIGEMEFPHPYYVAASFMYDKDENQSDFFIFAVSREKEYAIFSWETHPGVFLVAATDPHADPAEILDYFKDFIAVFAYKE